MVEHLTGCGGPDETVLDGNIWTVSLRFFKSHYKRQPAHAPLWCDGIDDCLSTAGQTR
jgi:hypothetical protein